MSLNTPEVVPPQHEDFYTDGYCAFWEDKTLKDNPYWHDQTAYDYWIQGWVDAFHQYIHANDLVQYSLKNEIPY